MVRCSFQVQMASESKRQSGVDRISELPDAVLCHIFSFLPTIYAMWTTVLSRRWNNLWTSLPNLSFDNKDFPTNHTMSPIQSFKHFMSAVEGALSLHCLSDIRKFCLSISVEHFSVEDLSRINSLIYSAIRHNVVEMNLSFWAEDYMKDPFILPQSLFMCTTLEDLKVFSDFNTCAPTTTGNLPSLKVLHVSVLWSDENAPESFFQNCPVLEDLTIAGSICFHDIDYINITAHALKRLRISLRCYHEYYDSWYTFFINAPNMEYFDLKEDAFSNYIFKNTKSLVKAKVHFLDEIQYQDEMGAFYDKDPGFANRATVLLAGISNVEYLSLDNQPHCLEVCYVPALDNLTKLKLVLHDCYHWELLTELLIRSPKLKYLVLEHIHTNVDNKYPEQSESRWNPPDFVPICLLSRLKTIKIRGFKGKRDEMEVAQYLLKNSDVLNEMAIYTGDLQCTKEEFIEEFGMFQRGSKACKVLFS
ncbi:F-box protein At4g22280 isoform X2 [Rosa chinensis]|uniref:F-box protein At4g22280 isoform X2 n=1 Tax=Rosa chinensis TaxID=74649 RepID=UPI001AD92B97|nr:F-box protein At4g22280 isoform X2 [Rosa chinensis]